MSPNTCNPSPRSGHTLGGTDAASFDIVGASGQLQTKAALDSETRTSYSVTVAVRDAKGIHGNPDTTTDDTITVSISVTHRGRSARAATGAVRAPTRAARSLPTGVRAAGGHRRHPCGHHHGAARRPPANPAP